MFGLERIGTLTGDIITLPFVFCFFLFHANKLLKGSNDDVVVVEVVVAKGLTFFSFFLSIS